MAVSPILPPTSAMAILMPLTMLVVWALALPVRGRLETILTASAAKAEAERAIAARVEEIRTI